MDIIGLCGKKGVGKNFVAELVQEVVREAGGSIEVAAYAEPLKEFCINALGLERSIVYGTDADKCALTERYSWDDKPLWVRGTYPDKSGLMSNREVMQFFGTDVMRDLFDKNIWVNSMMRRVGRSEAEVFVITDVRFPNEIDCLRDVGGKIWLVDGPQRGPAATQNDKHASEMLSESKVQYDVVIRNDLGCDRNAIKAQVTAALGIGRNEKWARTSTQTRRRRGATPRRRTTTTARLQSKRR